MTGGRLREFTFAPQPENSGGAYGYLTLPYDHQDLKRVPHLTLVILSYWYGHVEWIFLTLDIPLKLLNNS